MPGRQPTLLCTYFRRRIKRSATSDSTCYVSTKDQLCTIDIKMQAEMQAYIRLFQEHFAAINNDTVLNNTKRVGCLPGVANPVMLL